MIIFEVNFLFIYKNIDEFGIVCKKKKSFYKNITIILFGPFFFSLSFFFFFSFFFFLYEMSKLGVRPIRQCGLYAGKYGMSCTLCMCTLYIHAHKWMYTCMWHENVHKNWSNLSAFETIAIILFRRHFYMYTVHVCWQSSNWCQKNDQGHKLFITLTWTKPCLKDLECSKAFAFGLSKEKRMED